MSSRAVPTLFCLLLTAAAVAGERGADAARDAAPAGQGCLEPGSWIVTETRVRSSGAAVTEKRKLTVVAKSDGAGAAVQESKWSVDAFESTGPARPLAGTRDFDALSLKPDRQRPDGVVAIGPKRYVCQVETYTLPNDVTIPKLGLGTWFIDDDQAAQAVLVRAAQACW